MNYQTVIIRNNRVVPFDAPEMDGVNLHICDGCGNLVVDVERHDRFHDRIVAIGKDARAGALPHRRYA